jgi:hypothetical protein
LNAGVRLGALASLPLVMALALAGCGAPYDDVQSFVDAANEEGAGFELGPSLSTDQEGHEVYALELEGSGGLAEEVDEEGQAHLGGGSLTVTESEDDAILEYEECESAVTLLCYRAGNVAIVLEQEIRQEQRERVDAAITALGNG